MRSRLAIFGTVALLLASCVGASRPAEGPRTSLRLGGAPADATVVIDDETLGPLEFVAHRGVALPAGTHRLTITAVGYFPYDREIVAPGGGAPIVIDARLVKIPE